MYFFLLLLFFFFFFFGFFLTTLPCQKTRYIQIVIKLIPNSYSAETHCLGLTHTQACTRIYIQTHTNSNTAHQTDSVQTKKIYIHIFLDDVAWDQHREYLAKDHQTTFLRLHYYVLIISFPKTLCLRITCIVCFLFSLGNSGIRSK